MQTATIGDINKGFKFHKAYMLYVVADDRPDGRCIFYVGQTRSGVSERVCAHVNGSFGKGPTPLGELIRRFCPQSLAWKIQAYQLDEVVPDNVRDKPTLLEMEQRLIAYFSPHLNIVHNKPHPLPPRYLKEALAAPCRQ